MLVVDYTGVAVKSQSVHVRAVVACTVADDGTGEMVCCSGVID